MKLSSAIFCATAAVGSALVGPAVASATDLHCIADSGDDITLIDGRTACRAAADTFGRAHSAGYDGLGYAHATYGATAYGIGAAGGVGAGEGEGGVPIALGIGRDAIAQTKITGTSTGGAESERGVGAPLFAVSIAFEGSRAQVISAESIVVCLGSAAFAWDAATGAACVATPFGRLQTPQTELG